jgi:hypothetical protein
MFRPELDMGGACDAPTVSSSAPNMPRMSDSRSRAVLTLDAPDIGPMGAPPTLSSELPLEAWRGKNDPAPDGLAALAGPTLGRLAASEDCCASAGPRARPSERPECGKSQARFRCLQVKVPMSKQDARIHTPPSPMLRDSASFAARLKPGTPCRPKKGEHTHNHSVRSLMMVDEYGWLG